MHTISALLYAQRTLEAAKGIFSWLPKWSYKHVYRSLTWFDLVEPKVVVIEFRILKHRHCPDNPDGDSWKHVYILIGRHRDLSRKKPLQLNLVFIIRFLLAILLIRFVIERKALQRCEFRFLILILESRTPNVTSIRTKARRYSEIYKRNNNRFIP